MSNGQTIVHVLAEARSRPNDWIAARFKRHKSWLELSWSEYFARIEAAALGLMALNLQPGDRVAILSNSRLEWAVTDFAILGLGAMTVPIYQSSKPEEVDWIIKHSEPKILFVEDATQLKKWEAIARRSKCVEQVICFDPLPDDADDETAISWDEFLRRGQGTDAKAFLDRLQNVKMSDPATIVYTSGTTGEPKGAVLSHQQIISEVADLVQAFPISAADSTLSFLPYAHVMGRVEIWLHVYLGFTLNFAESVDRLRANLKETKPTVILGVPRIFEKIYASLLAQVEGQPLKRMLFNWVGARHSLLPKVAGDLLLFRRLREELGGRLRFVVSGGAPLEPQLALFFRKAGLLLLEGYGLTETTAAICVNTPTHYEFGTVGRPLKDVEIKIAEDGEILVKSKKVMLEYYHDPEATKNAIRDGYFATGDVGVLTSSGFLKITDRKKDLIKTAGGKYVAPQKLEGLLKLNPLISHVLIHGDRQKYIVALITLNESYVKDLARENNWTAKDYKTLIQRSEIRELVRKEVARVNSQLASFETIKNFSILPNDFTIESGELTPSLKVKRKVCDEKYQDQIQSLY